MKQIIVNVEGLSTEEKIRMVEALVKIKNIKKCNPPHMKNIAALYGPSFDGINVGFNYHKDKEPTHTPQQVLEMAGMSTKRKVREDFDPTKEYSVSVLGCSEEEKKEVQQAFFDAGFPWKRNGKVFLYLNAEQYTNTTEDGVIVTYCMYGNDTEGCNMTVKEFLDLVYETESKGHVHAEHMAQYAKDAKTHAEPWKLWQISQSSLSDIGWIDCKFSPGWDPICEFRRKPKTHFVHGVEIPDLRINPKLGQGYWYPAANTAALVGWSSINVRNSFHSHRIANNICYIQTEEGKAAAILHAKAWLGLVQQ